MTDLNKKIADLDNELKLLKNEIQQCLLDIREHILTHYQPTSTSNCRIEPNTVATTNSEIRKDKGKGPIHNGHEGEQQRHQTVDEPYELESNDAMHNMGPAHVGSTPMPQPSDCTPTATPLLPSQRNKAFVTFSTGQDGPQVIAPAHPYNLMRSFPPGQSYGPIPFPPPTEFQEQIPTPRQRQSQRRSPSSSPKQLHRGDLRTPSQSRYVESVATSKADLMRELRDTFSASSFDEETNSWPKEQVNGRQLKRERSESPENPALDLNTIAMLAHWASNGVQKIGRERMEVVVDMYNMTGNLSSKARDTILKLVRFSEEEEPEEYIPISACIPLMMQLNTILTSESNGSEVPSVSMAF